MFGSGLSWYTFYELMFIKDCAELKIVQFHLHFEIYFEFKKAPPVDFSSPVFSKYKGSVI